MTLTRVVIADDHPLYRAGVASAIREADELELLGESDDGAEALALIRQLAPDVALVDIKMPGMNGIELCRTLRDEGAPTRVVMLSAAEEPALIREALEAGAHGFLTKESSDVELQAGVSAAAKGQTTISPRLQGGLFDEIAGRGSRARLSDAERNVLQLAADGATNTEIGVALSLSAGTVKSYLGRAFEKLDVRDRSQAVAEALRRGLIS